VVEVIKIVYVPIAKPEIQIIERFTPYIVEVPVEVKTSASIIEVPV
jgi:hypothetical protein